MMMMDRLAQMEAQYKQLAHYVRSQPAPALAPAPAPIPEPIPIPADAARPVGPKLAKPEIFDGERAKCQSFLRSVRMYIAVNHWQFASENTKVLYALSFIQRQKVDNWKNEVINRALNWRDNGGYDPVVSDFRRFPEELEKMFGDPNPRETAISMLSTLRQGNEPAEEYIMKFEALRADTGYNDVALVELFKHGMNPGLLNWRYSLHPLPGDYKAWSEEAIWFDRQWREAQSYAKRHGQGRQQGQPQQRQGQRQGQWQGQGQGQQQPTP